MFNFFDKKFLKTTFVVIIFVICHLLFFTKLSFFDLTRLKGYDLLTKLSYSLKPPSNSLNDIVAIVLDDASYNVLAKKWPWPRTMFASFLNRLKKYKPKVIAFDLSYSGESQDRNDDLEFATSLKDLGNCILSSHFSMQGEYVLPLELLLTSAKDVGFVNKIRDRDNYIRSARAVVLSTEGDVLDYCFEIKIVKEYLGLNSLQYNKDAILLKNSAEKITIPINRIGGLNINYKAKETDLKIIPFWKVMKMDLAEDIFKDKIVLVGAAAEMFHDTYPTPLGIMPGIFIVANTLQTILNQDFIYKLPKKMEFLIILLVGLVVTFFTYRFSLIKALFLNLVFLSLVSWGLLELFLKKNILGDLSSVFIIGTGIFLGMSGFRYLRLIVESNILKNEAVTDALTGIYGFRYFDLRLKSEFERTKRYNESLSLIILDIDHFKSINDTYGHDDGNIILKGIAQILKEKSRKVDIVARFGGEEFCIILPQITQGQALNYAERIRQLIQDTPFNISRNRNININVSLGVSSFNKDTIKSADELLKQADTALYKAKNSGRNKVCV